LSILCGRPVAKRFPGKKRTQPCPCSLSFRLDPPTSSTTLMDGTCSSFGVRAGSIRRFRHKRQPSYRTGPQLNFVIMRQVLECQPWCIQRIGIPPTSIEAIVLLRPSTGRWPHYVRSTPFVRHIYGYSNALPLAKRVTDNHEK
ncbi:unnamed protein product, partial [Ectocarpus sp. 8 AP-2014]